MSDQNLSLRVSALRERLSAGGFAWKHRSLGSPAGWWATAVLRAPLFSHRNVAAHAIDEVVDERRSMLWLQ